MLFCRRSLHPRPSKKSERKRPSFYTNPIAPHSSIRSGQVIIAMEELQDGAVPEGDYEEPEDEVQEVGGELSVGSLSNDVFLDRNRKWSFSLLAKPRFWTNSWANRLCFFSFCLIFSITTLLHLGFCQLHKLWFFRNCTIFYRISGRRPLYRWRFLQQTWRHSLFCGRWGRRWISCGPTR